MLIKFGILGLLTTFCYNFTFGMNFQEETNPARVNPQKFPIAVNQILKKYQIDIKKNFTPKKTKHTVIVDGIIYYFKNHYRRHKFEECYAIITQNDPLTAALILSDSYDNNFSSYQPTSPQSESVSPQNDSEQADLRYQIQTTIDLSKYSPSFSELDAQFLASFTSFKY